jgi:hypothetical protein
LQESKKKLREKCFKKNAGKKEHLKNCGKQKNKLKKYGGKEKKVVQKIVGKKNVSEKKSP